MDKSLQKCTFCGEWGYCYIMYAGTGSTVVCGGCGGYPEEKPVNPAKMPRVCSSCGCWETIYIECRNRVDVVCADCYGYGGNR